MLPVMARAERRHGLVAMYALNLLEMALILAEHDRAYQDTATKFFEHFAYIAEAMRAKGLWNDDDGFFYDVLAFQNRERLPLRVRSMVGLLPLAATTTLRASTLRTLPDFADRVGWFVVNKGRYRGVVGETHERDGATGRLLAVVDGNRLVRILATMLDEAKFLSPYGLGALSRRHREAPFTIEFGGMTYRVDYQPGESTSGLFGGNSNWRGPIWFPVNYLVIEAIRRFARFYGDDLLVEHPTGSGTELTLTELADDLSRRLVRIFLDDDTGRRPVFGNARLFQDDPRWHDLLPFHEYFHGDTGRGLGASHQTGWTALVADLILHSSPHQKGGH